MTTKLGLVDRLERLAAFLQERITPGLRYSQNIFEDQLRRQSRETRTWLDLGCGHRLLSEWRGDAEAELLRGVPLVVGLDADVDAIRRHRSIPSLCAGDIATLPFRDASFELVTANMVVEHLSDPVAQFSEVYRVLRPGGMFLFHTPNVRTYVIRIARLLPDSLKQLLARLLEGRTSADVYPTHYRANDASAIRRVAAASGLIVDQIEHITSTPALSRVPPLLVPELLWIRQLQRRPTLNERRPDIICTLRKPTHTATTAA